MRWSKWLILTLPLILGACTTVPGPAIEVRSPVFPRGDCREVPLRSPETAPGPPALTPFGPEAPFTNGELASYALGLRGALRGCIAVIESYEEWALPAP